MNDQVLCDIDTRGVATVTMNRPEKHNAFDDALIAALTETFIRLGRDKAVRAVVLTGAGISFSSGADIGWMRAMAGYDEATNYEDALRLAELMSTLDALPKATVARVNGPVFGGGVGLVACCDIAIAASNAKFALTEVRLGLVPAVISPYVLAAIGPRQARRWFLTGEAFTAEKALAIGLVHEVVEPAALDSAVEHQLELLLHGGPKAQRACKELIAQETGHGTSAMRQLRKMTAKLIAQLRVSEEGQEGLTAFLEKRPPTWRK
ncbi:MAG TPA: enoyl-CoA hydratase/isomerase family protein [Gammaproteobacteria bacterium]|nr:enoyl-CoA hydratase/isomerase family protein [Gammaproteobacteria bacterium]